MEEIMIKWPIKYVDYNGEEHTDSFYFNLTKAELTEMQFDANGAYSEFITRIAEEKSYKALGAEFKRIILMSYGIKSDDGRYFRKSQQIRDDFEQSPAYSELYMELLSDADKAAKFMKGILPQDLQGNNSIAPSK